MLRALWPVDTSTRIAPPKGRWAVSVSDDYLIKKYLLDAARRSLAVGVLVTVSEQCRVMACGDRVAVNLLRKF